MTTELNIIKNMHSSRRDQSEHHNNMIRQEGISSRSGHDTSVVSNMQHAKFFQTSPYLTSELVPAARTIHSYAAGNPNPAFIQTPDLEVLSPSAARVNHSAAAMVLPVSQSTKNATAACSTNTNTNTTVVANPTTGEAANYKDYSRVSSDAGTQQKGAPNNKASGKDDSFPIKLHQMLSVQDYEEFITWMPHGRSWRVVKPKAFEAKVIPLCFRHAKYASFMRQVNGWGFKRVTQGPDHNSYYHELFLRGLPQLCDKMRRPPKTKRGASSTATSESTTVDPDFTRLSLIAPLPSAGGAPLAPQQHHQLVPAPQHHSFSPPSLAVSPQHHQYPLAYVTSVSAEGSGEGSGSGSGEGGSYGSRYTGSADGGGGDDDGGSSGEDKAAVSDVRKESNLTSDTTRQMSNGVTFSSASSEYAGGSEGGEDSSSDSGTGSSEDGGTPPNQQNKSSSSSSKRDINQNNHVYPFMGGGPMLAKQAMHPSSEAAGNMPCIVVQQQQGGNQPQQMMFQQQPQMARVVNQHGDELGYIQLPSNQGGFSNQMFQNPAMMQTQNPQFMQGQMLRGMPQSTYMPQATIQQQCMMENQAIPQQLMMQQPQQQLVQNQTMQQQQEPMQQSEQLHNQAMQQQQQQQYPQAAMQQLFHPQTMAAQGSGQQFHNVGTMAFPQMMHSNHHAVTQPPRRSQEQEQ